MATSLITTIEVFNGTSTPVTPFSFSSTLTLAVGDVVHVYFGFEDISGSNNAPGVTVTCADNLGNTYTQKARQNFTGGGSANAQGIVGFECIVTTAGTATISGTFGGGFQAAWQNGRAFHFRPSGTATTDVGTTGQGTGTAVSLTGVTVGGAGAMSMAHKSFGSVTTTSSWGTTAGTNAGVDSGGAYLITSASGTQTPAATISVSHEWVGAAIHTLGGGGGTLAADFGTYSLTGQDAQLTENLSTSTNISGLVIGSAASWIGASYVGASDASAPSGGSPYTLTAAQGSYSLSGQAAILRAGRVLVAAQGTYTLTGQAAALGRGWKVVAVQGTYTLSGQAAGLKRGLKVTAAQGTYTITGSDALADFAVTAAQGTYAITGQAATLTYSGAGSGSPYTLTAAQGTYTLTGQAAALRVGRALVSAQGTYALSGQAAALRTARTLTSAQGSYTLTGQSATLRTAYMLSAAQGSYTLTGQAATLTYSGPASGSPYTLTAEQGSYAITGQAARLATARTLTVAQGTYAVTGQAATLRTDRTIAAAQGSYSISGQAAALTAAVAARMTAETGVYVLLGGSVADYAPPSTISSGGGGGGGGRIYYQGKGRAYKRGTLDKQIDKILDDVIAERVYRGVVEAGEGKAVAKAVKPHTESRAAVPAPERVDWDALARDADAVSLLLQTWRRIEREREIAEDDEEWMLM